MELADKRTRGRPGRFMNAVVKKKKGNITGGEMRGEGEMVSPLIETAERKRRATLKD